MGNMINLKWSVLGAYLFAAILTGCVSESGGGPYIFSNDWLNDVTVFVYGKPPLSYLLDVRAEVITWSVYHGGFNTEELAYVEQLHRHGIKVASNFPTMQASASVVGSETNLEDFACRDIHGNPVRALWIQPDPPYLPCHNNPHWQEFMKERIKEHIDGGVDAVHFDEIEGIGGHLYVAGFCEYCMQAFRNYLAERFSPDELLEKFGITDISTFDYRKYLIQHGASTPAGDPNVALRREFVYFQLKSRKEQIRELITFAREYAGRDIAFAANTFFYTPNKQHFIEDMDFTVSENFVEYPPYARYVGTYLLARAISPGKPVVMFPTIIDLLALSISGRQWQAIAFRLAEAAASGASFLIPYHAYVFGGGTSTVSGAATLPADTAAMVTEFIREHSDIVRETEPIGDVAVFYDYSCALEEYTIQGFATPWMPSGSVHTGYLGMTTLLEKAHIPFVALYEGDGDLVSTNTASATLPDVKLIIVPYEPCNSHDPAGLLNKARSAGIDVLYLPQASTYWSTGSSQIAQRLISTVQERLGGKTSIFTDASDTLGIIPVKGDGHVILHFLNYNYSVIDRDFVYTSPFTLTYCGNNLSSIHEVIFYTMEKTQKIQARAGDNGCIKMEIPPFNMWGFVEL